ncbi:MAG: MBL fold metallo-hydrolase [Alphaproteobacteria bacterium]|jgi:phosphoribosyl 1,2-cyclic phosphate phosphodiesterase|nr:MBL fold metallo-hydrolase [Alphaproteobacteria bacterium]
MSVLEITVLGSGSSGGVPRADGHWGVCDPAEPRNRRRRCSMLLRYWQGEQGSHADATTVLIDTSPDLREQLLAAEARRLDGVLYTHAHADQAHGIDDLRALAYRMRRLIPVWMDAPTQESMVPRFRYCFEGGGGYPPIVQLQPDLQPFAPVMVEGPGGTLEALPLPQDHGGGVASLGFRIGRFGYSNDMVALSEETLEALKGLDLWVADALRETPHPTHSHVAQTLAWAKRLKPRRTLLTNLHVDLDYQTLKAKLPERVEPAYDGQVLIVDL